VSREADTNSSPNLESRSLSCGVVIAHLPAPATQDLRLERLRGERFGEIVRRARADRLGDAAALGFGRHHHHGNRAQVRILLDATQAGETVHLRHVPVHQHERDVAGVLFQLIERERAVLGLQHLVAEHLDRARGDLSDDARIVDGEDFHAAFFPLAR
jgi:hypothetical protein